jgi:hypothetical protein
MGLAPSELENVTPYQFNLLREGFQERQLLEWDRTRFSAYYTYVMAGKIVENPVSMEEFRPLRDNDLKAIKKAKSKPNQWSPEQAEQAFDYFNPHKEAANIEA